MKLKLPPKQPAAAPEEGRRVNKPLVFTSKPKPSNFCNTCMKWYERAIPQTLKDKSLRFCTHNSCWTPPDAKCGAYSPDKREKTVYKGSQP
ncbi:hypothetical protein EVB27_111 [Rhizobium phage RHph_TM16]|nr:hypothetical protein EVB27_111 [Rhizobium phage RHph_TM16]